ncbi:MAG: 5-oxoprolinase subunit PxpB [Chloroflexi bacterium]|nr:5-oxoprolinase subunit PxpB [Chloroflexota bacterium]
MIFPVPRVLPFGDSAFLIEFADEIDTAVNARVRGLDDAIGVAGIPGILETIPAYSSLLVEYDPLISAFAEIRDRLIELAQQDFDSGTHDTPLKTVPTVYGGEQGPDLADVARVHGLTPDQVIAIHSGREYVVYMLGFTPGFAYMGQVSEEIATPRLPAPRTHVPIGSVGIAGRQTGVYPLVTPGGWRLLGRTRVAAFDPSKDPACFFQPGDRVRFLPVQADDFSPLQPALQAAQAIAGRELVEVVSPGFLTTVQDLGRCGFQRFGVPVSGAMDSFALRAANALVGNDAGAAALESTGTGLVLRFLSDGIVAVTGGGAQPVLRTPALNAWHAPTWTALYVRAGSLLDLGDRDAGCRTYVAFGGGIAVSSVLNSQSTYLPGGFGGFLGRALQAGDSLRVGEPRVQPAAVAGRILKLSNQPVYAERVTLRVVLGPRAARFTADAIRTLLTQEYAVSIDSDRMGLRLDGPALERSVSEEIISNGIALGAVQVPPNGQPIVLAADRQTIGGYPIIASVIRADLPLTAQCTPGQSSVRFRQVTVEQAQSLYRAMAARPTEIQVDSDAGYF